MGAGDPAAAPRVKQKNKKQKNPGGKGKPSKYLGSES